jgi:hypothetical protein
MPSFITQELLRSYQTTKYIVLIENEPIRLTIGNTYHTIDSLLARHNVNSAYFITPENPFSQNLGTEENSLRHKRFVSELQDLNTTFYEGYGTDEEEIWPKEMSYLILCDDAGKMHALAARYGQNAFLNIATQQPVTLLLLEPMCYVEAK